MKIAAKLSVYLATGWFLGSVWITPPLVYWEIVVTAILLVVSCLLHVFSD